MLRLVDFLFLLRPTLLVPVWTFLFLGYQFAQGEKTLSVTIFMPKVFWIVFFSYSLLMGATYILNQIWDRETDRINKKLFLLSEGIMPIYLAISWLFLALGVSLYLLSLIGGSYAILWAISLLMGFLYSTPPFKFKGRPFFDLLSNAIGYGFVNFLVGWNILSSIKGISYLHSLPYIFMVGAVFLNTTVPDIPGDKASGEVTTGVFLGAKKTTFIAFLSIIVALIFGILLKDPFSAIASLVSIPFFYRAWQDPVDLKVKFSYRIGGGSLVLLVALRYVLFLALLIFTYLALKVYYKKRFGLDYPTLKGR